MGLAIVASTVVFIVVLVLTHVRMKVVFLRGFGSPFGFILVRNRELTQIYIPLGHVSQVFLLSAIPNFPLHYLRRAQTQIVQKAVQVKLRYVRRQICYNSGVENATVRTRVRDLDSQGFPTIIANCVKVHCASTL